MPCPGSGIVCCAPVADDDAGDATSCWCLLLQWGRVPDAVAGVCVTTTLGVPSGVVVAAVVVVVVVVVVPAGALGACDAGAPGVVGAAVGKGVAAPPITPGVTNPNATAVPACLALSSVA